MTLTTDTQLTRSELQSALRYYRDESTVLVQVKLSAKTTELQAEYDRIQNHIAILNKHYDDATEAKEVTTIESNETYAEDPSSIPMGICRQYVIGKSEADAYQLGNSPSALLQRLKDARSCLNDYLAKRFKTYTYDFTNKRLVSDCKNFHLQWKLRANSDQPESYGNQQTSRGTVICLDAKPKHNILSQYTTV